MEKINTNRTFDWAMLALFVALMMVQLLAQNWDKALVTFAFSAATVRILLYLHHIEQLYKGEPIKGDDDDGGFNNTTKNIKM